MRRVAELALAFALAFATAGAWAAPACDKPVYLSFDTGHMGVADLIADVLKRHEVKVTFFLANEKTQDGGTSLDAHWAAWWKARAAEGHAFGTHTWDHMVWQADVPGGLKLRPTAGEQAGRTQTLDAAAYCEQLRKPARWFEEATGQPMLPLFRAPAGRTSAKLLEAARQCGFRHVGWAPAGFLGDELPSEQYPNRKLLDNALREIRPGDILVAHLGIWSRKDAWAPAVLEPLVEGLQQRGFCFRTLAEHPMYRDWIASHPLKFRMTP